MISSIIEMFSYSFMVKAFIVGIMISISSALLGVSLVLRGNSMIGDGISHVSFASVAIASVIGLAPIQFSIPVVILVSFLIVKISNSDKISGDSIIGIMSASALAIGTFIISVVSGVNIDLNSYLFGSILSLSKTDLILTILLTVAVITIFVLFYHKIFAITFDETFTKSIGINVTFYNMLFSALCSVTIVLGMRLIGSLLISSLVIFPTLTSIRLFKKFRSVVISSVVVSLIAFTFGLVISYFFSTPTGATIVIVNLALFLISTIASKIKINKQ